ncbi:late embryogenesis abundant protein At1g64065-like [Salvia miltiorrhiza]|uniref:late embryogenesis abundant protein At1g64065-like n=1 Tax=Salvia miltiorrhiza TaxID=226208 RepID=UPI0025ACBB53|nr:late embryogenesis abundant protein At1g64065-like [Salvia miltiorrhiza]
MDKPPEQIQQQIAAAAAAAVLEERDRAKAAIRRRRRLRCCSCVGASFLVGAIFSLTLAFTVFKVRGPVIIINRCTSKLDLINGTSRPRPGSNATIRCDVSMKNRNFASFRHGSSTSLVYYRGSLIAESHAPPGNMRARRTARMNVTAYVMLGRVAALPGFGSDVNSGSVRVSWYSRMGGRVKFLILKKHVTVKMKCTGSVDFKKFALTDYHCKQKFKL